MYKVNISFVGDWDSEKATNKEVYFSNPQNIKRFLEATHRSDYHPVFKYSARIERLTVPRDGLHHVVHDVWMLLDEVNTRVLMISKSVEDIMLFMSLNRLFDKSKTTKVVFAHRYSFATDVAAVAKQS